MRAAFIIAASVAALLTVTGQAQAQANRTFVSGHGADSNSCGLAAPCRTFAQAITQTNVGGEIVVLDSAGYGPLTINKSITITNPGGVEAGVTAGSGVTAITINTAAADVVTLRGLTLDGANVGAGGILFKSTLPAQSFGGTLNIINCAIKNFNGDGVSIQPSVTAGTIPALYVVVADSFLFNNAGNGINFSPPKAVNVNASIYRTVITTNTFGITLVGPPPSVPSDGFLGALLFDDVISGNLDGGIALGGTLFVTVKSSMIKSNGGIADIINNAPNGFSLFDRNTIGILQNNTTTSTDGTNNIDAIGGNFTLGKLSTQ